MAEEEEQEQNPIDKIGVYTGERNAQDERHGYGENRFPNGDIYKGHYEKGVRMGEGKYYWKEGAIYQGNYVNHQKEGHGLMKYPDGSVYEGDFHEGKRHGSGKYTYPNGDTYEGEWYQGKKHGKGVFTIHKDKSTYTGIWFLGQIKRGVWDIPDGSYYAGKFEKQRPNQEGKFVMVNRNAVTGQFKEETKSFEVPIEQEKKEGGNEEEAEEDEEEGKKEAKTKKVEKITLRQFIPISFTTLTPDAVEADHDIEPEEGELDIPIEVPKKKTKKRVNEDGEEEEVEEEEEQAAEEES